MRKSEFVPSWFCFALLFTLCTFCGLSAAQQRDALPTEAAAPVNSLALGRLPASYPLHLAISLTLRSQEELDELLADLYDQASPQYRHFLTAQQFTERFSPSASDYQRVLDFAQSSGLHVTHTFPNRLVVDVTGPASAVEHAFGVRMYLYQHPTENRTFYAPDVEPTIESELPILTVDGLSTFSLPRPMLKKRLPAERVQGNVTGSGPGGQFLGSDMRAAYGGGTALDGAGQVVGLIELGPYRLADVLNYFSTLSQPLNVPLANVLVGVDGVCGAGCDDGEEAIDIQQAIAMAPNLSALIVYETNGPNTDALSAYAQAAADNIAKQLSISFGWGGTPSSEAGYEQVFKELAAQGQSSFVASGDAGANIGGGGYPGNSPNITDAGGTDLTIGTGSAWQSETGWVGSGGGWNTQSPIPTGLPNFSWNQSPVINATNGGDSNYRNIPDVSAEANTDNYFCANGSCQGGIGGTSLAAPRWAAFMALINQQVAANANPAGSNATFGFVNPSFYTIGQGSGYGVVFHDITSGNDNNGTTCTTGTLGCNGGEQGFNAVTGFDLVTGWGSPNGPTIFDAIAPLTSHANFSMSATPAVLNLTAGSSNTSSISVSALNGFSAATNLAVVIPGTGSPSYAPAGLTATLNASSIPAGGGSVTLTVSTTSATPGGTYVIAVVGTSASLTQTAYVTVELPAFVGLTAAPAVGFSLPQSSTAASTISATVINGFNSAISLSSSGLLSGVTAAFTSVNATTSTATFSATSSAALTGAGKPAAVINGMATGSAAQSAAVNLFVNPALSGGSGTAVDLSSAFNIYAFYDDANESSITASNSLDGVGYAYSANLLGAGANFNSTQFTFGSPNQPNAVYGTGSTITLPNGIFSSLEMIATGLQGNQASQTVKVNYTDGTSSTFAQSFSDWCSALNGNGCVSTGSNSGESVAVAMPYRDSAGGSDDRVFYVYHYSFALNTSKTVQSLSLPSNRNVVVLAATLRNSISTYTISTGNPSQATISPGGSSQSNISITPGNGYTGTITLSCSISPVVTPAPTCSFGGTSPVTITGSAGTATLTFTTVAATASANRSKTLYALFLPTPFLMIIGICCGVRDRLRQKLPGLFILLFFLFMLLFAPACGGGGSSSPGGGGGGSTGTPAGTYTVTVTGQDGKGASQFGSAPTVTFTVN